MSHSQPPPPAPRRFWRRLVQYRLRTLLIVTAMVAGALGWWSYKARQQHVTVVELYRIGCIGIEYEKVAPLRWTEWLSGHIGVDYVANVEEINLAASQTTDASMVHFRTLTKVKVLCLCNTPVTDAGLKHTYKLMALRYLDLEGTKVTDAGLEHLKQLTALRFLQLRKTRVTDAGVARLQQSLPNCKIEH